jgi:glycosyltransferase involved in cell wall biosynthesis
MNKNIKIKENLISVIVPSFQKEKTIKKELETIGEVLEKLRYDFEIICVVDGKIDRTFEMAKKAKVRDLKVVGYKNNKGKGYAVRFGMARSRGDIIAFIDSGMDLNPNGLSMLLEHFEWYNADIIVGSKRHPASRVNYPLERRILSIGYQALVGLLFGLKVKDTQVGIKFFKRRVLEDVLPRLLVKRFAFDIEILSVANRLGYKRIYEAPIDLKFDNKKSIVSKSLRQTLSSMLIDTLAVFYRLRILKYYDNKNKKKWRYDPELDFKVRVE